MLRFLFDTDHLTLFDKQDPHVCQRFALQPANTVGISAVTVEESLRGWLAWLSRQQAGALHVQAYAKLVGAVKLLNRFPIVAFDATCEIRYQRLRALRIRIGSKDLKIAAIALVNNLTLLTRNRRDFLQVPGIVLDDWSV
jgi:tRNA(fMet)-specific endonuclease VapC